VYAIRAGQLIDGSGGEPLQDAVVLVEDTIIAAAGSAATVEIPHGTEVIDASGKTVMPGLIDTHVHIMATSASLEQE